MPRFEIEDNENQGPCPCPINLDVEVQNIYIPGLIDKLEEIENRTNTIIVISPVSTAPTATIENTEEFNAQHSSNSRKLTIVGEDHKKTRLAKRLLLERVLAYKTMETKRLENEELRVIGEVGSNFVTVEVKIDNANAGKIIGRGGANIKSLKERTNTKIFHTRTRSSPGDDLKLLFQVYGNKFNNQKDAAIELLLLNQYFNWIRGRHLFNFAKKDNGLKVQVKSIYAGRIIGKSGHNLKELEKTTNTRIFVTPQANENVEDKPVIFTIFGHNSKNQKLAGMLIKKRNIDLDWKDKENAKLENLGIDPFEVVFNEPKKKNPVKCILVASKLHQTYLSIQEALLNEGNDKGSDDRNISRLAAALRRRGRKHRTLPNKTRSYLDGYDRPFSCPKCCRGFSCHKSLTKHCQGKLKRCDDEFRMKPSEKELANHQPGNPAFDEVIEIRRQHPKRVFVLPRRRTKSLPSRVVPSVRTRYYSVACTESEIIIGPPTELLPVYRFIGLS